MKKLLLIVFISMGFVTLSWGYNYLEHIGTLNKAIDILQAEGYTVSIQIKLGTARLSDNNISLLYFSKIHRISDLIVLNSSNRKILLRKIPLFEC